ncbi:putative quinol monooxygenase, partial [Actinocorallia longicatena]|uniref:putative quinol monooxygenase n=1 Tax=Actinocorallia longicatena TaxID=111803 RepID=UPI0031DA753F
PPQGTGARPLPRQATGAHAAPQPPGTGAHGRPVAPVQNGTGPYPAPTPAPSYPAPNGTGGHDRNGTGGYAQGGTGAHASPGGVPQKAPIVGDDWFAAPAPPPRPQPSGPHGQIVVYTLLDGREQAFDRLANELARVATQNEPDILIYTFHEVEGAPTQRISYQLFSDREAHDEHQRQPYVARFAADSRTHVLATNVIDLKLTGGSLPFLQAPR